MSNSLLVAIVHTGQDIQHKNCSVLFWESAVGFNLVKKLSSLKTCNATIIRIETRTFYGSTHYKNYRLQPQRYVSPRLTL
jgi:hypothetical protein